MCGICGILYFDKQRLITGSTIQKMTTTITSRGPDDEGVYINNNIGLGMRRLSIIDIEGGKQPVSNEGGTLHATLNGELYNYKEIKRYELRTGHHFTSNSDTEIIPHLYEDYGDEFIKKINGMFAIALWDERQQKLLVYRDRLGIKPLYYYHNDQVFVWGSEIKAILASGLVKKRINPKAVDLYFRFGYVPAPYSIFEGIKKVLPGHYLKIQNGTLTTQAYWHLGLNNHHIPLKEIEHELYELLTQSVKYRLISDVPLGTFLSGGVDSSFVTGIMQELTGGPIETFSIKFSEKEFDESYYARRVSRFLGTTHFEFEVRPNPQETLSRILPYFDEPFADKSVIPAYYVSKMARQRVTVALSGDGGDELFGGYLKYRTLKAAGIYHRMNPFFAQTLKMGSYLPSKLGSRLRNASYYGAMGAWERFLSCTEIMSNKQRDDILNRETIPLLANEEIPATYHLSSTSSDLQTIDEEMNNWLQIDMKTYLVDDILTKVDRMSMCHSLEIRVPLLDHRVVEYVVALPARIKLKGFQGKHIFKNIARNVIPKDIIYRQKHAWIVPIERWLRDDLKSCIDQMLSTDNSNINEILNVQQLQKIVGEHYKSMNNHSTTLWNALAFFIWYTHWWRGKQN